MYAVSGRPNGLASSLSTVAVNEIRQREHMASESTRGAAGSRQVVLDGDGPEFVRTVILEYFLFVPIVIVTAQK